MAAQSEALADTAMFDLDASRDEGRRRHHTVMRNAEDLSGQRRALVEIVQMADKLSLVLQEIRNTTVETSGYLRQAEVDLALLEMEI